MQKNAEIYCRRCGACCKKGGPALHVSDSKFIKKYSMKHIFCLRKSEWVFDPKTEKIQPLKQEILKFRGQNGSWCCVFYTQEDAGCTIYAHRPLECQKLFCGDTTALLDVLQEPYLQRKDCIALDSPLGECICEHEKMFPVQEALMLARSGEKGADLDLQDLLRREELFRSVLAEKVLCTDAELWPYLGRPLTLVVQPFVSKKNIGQNIDRNEARLKS